MKKSFDLRVFRDNNYTDNVMKMAVNVSKFTRFIHKGYVWINLEVQRIYYHRIFKGNYYMKSYDIVTGITRLEINDNIVRTKEGNQKFYYDMDGKVVEIK